jgi:hypothetical protein
MLSPDQAAAKAMLAAGPAPLSEARRDLLRYHITDRIDDLRGERTAAEVQAIGVSLYAILSELMLAGAGLWLGYAKWVPRRLAVLDPALEARFSAAFARLFAQGDAAAVIALAEAVLAPYGGPLFDGYYEAPAETNRMAAPPQET